MRILLHDYPGHAFPVELARALAKRGHEVLHLYFAGFPSPRGPVAPRDDDPPSLTIEAIAMPGGFDKYNLWRRPFVERAYGRLLARRALAFRPDVVIGGNGPLDPQAMLAAASARMGAGFLFWLQDAYGIAIDNILRRKLPVVGAVVGAYYRWLERRLWRGSDRIVAITEDFRPLLDRHAVDPARVAVIENWAGLAEVPERPRDNAWARAHALVDKRVLLYSGTLGLKHNPALLLALAERFRDDPDARVVVVTEGPMGAWLAREAAAKGLANLILLGFQPHEALPDVVASADALVVLLEADAGVYSVPSKVLTYCCAGRAVLGAIPSENLAARLIRREGIGVTVEPSDSAGFTEAAAALLADDGFRRDCGRRGRAYAEAAFDIARITDRFERLLTEAVATRRQRKG